MIKFIPSQDFERAFQQAREDVETWYGVGSRQGEGKRTDTLTGERCRTLMLNRRTTIALLQSRDVTSRLAAISLIVNYWPASEVFAGDVLQMAFEDPESSIRGAALVALRQLVRYIDDPSGFLRRLLSALAPPENEEEDAELEHVVEQAVQSSDDAMQRMIQKAAGPHLPAMLKSRAASESYLSHSNPELRGAAILVLKNHWGADEAFARSCERMIFEDEDTEVRSLAVAGLAGYYMRTDDTRVGALVAGLVLDDTEPLDLRLCAHRSLLTIRGMPYKTFLSVTSPTFRFPEDIEWEFVDSFLSGPS